FGKQVHWDGAKAEDASLLIFGEGPGTSSQVEPTAGKFSGLDPKAVVYILPEQYKWRDPTGAAGVNQLVLHGDPTKNGPYVVLNRFKPGNFSKPHFHPNDRFIIVVKGTWWVATGNKVDKENMAFRQADPLGRRQRRRGLGSHRGRGTGNTHFSRGDELAGCIGRSPCAPMKTLSQRSAIRR
ncbi:MAG: hypothetical protein E6G78_02870, partial [Alphaproteobacteria bacterium]